jgi:hypothetical protein
MQPYLASVIFNNFVVVWQKDANYIMKYIEFNAINAYTFINIICIHINTPWGYFWIFGEAY